MKTEYIITLVIVVIGVLVAAYLTTGKNPFNSYEEYPV